MNVLVRKTIAGNEYWNTEEKRTIFVPKGKKPNFVVTENPTSMITPESEVVGSVDFAEVEKDITIDGNGEIIEKQAEATADYINMSLKQLKQYVVDNKIDIPATLKKKDDIVKYLSGYQ